MRARRAENPEGRGNGSIVDPPWRGLGAVGNRCIVAYCARSPTRSAAEGHAHTRRSNPLQFKLFRQLKHLMDVKQRQQIRPLNVAQTGSA